ncbi:hypothetical protein BC835DRAFT_392187 [Cytidiella melzeri]|nr:hypothetical protein BC835DRAFT_392187 [Cytidiella melzeri]
MYCYRRSMILLSLINCGPCRYLEFVTMLPPPFQSRWKRTQGMPFQFSLDLRTVPHNLWDMQIANRSKTYKMLILKVTMRLNHGIQRIVHGICPFFQEFRSSRTNLLRLMLPLIQHLFMPLLTPRHLHPQTPPPSAPSSRGKKREMTTLRRI